MVSLQRVVLISVGGSFLCGRILSPLRVVISEGGVATVMEDLRISSDLRGVDSAPSTSQVSDIQAMVDFLGKEAKSDFSR